MKKYIILLLILIIAVITFVYGFKKDKLVEKPGCQNKEHSINITLQSGEKGTIKLIDNHCDFNIAKPNNDLSFSILTDGAMKENIYGSRFYFWLRDKNLTAEQQIKSIVDKVSKGKLCEVIRSDYLQRDGLIAYDLKKDNKISNDCSLFGDLSDLSTEVFMEANNLLILQRQDGMDGIEPFNLASVRFIEN